MGQPAQWLPDFDHFNLKLKPKTRMPVCILCYCRAVRMFFGTAPGWLVRQGLMSSPPRRV